MQFLSGRLLVEPTRKLLWSTKFLMLLSRVKMACPPAVLSAADRTAASEDRDGGVVRMGWRLQWHLCTAAMSLLTWIHGKGFFFVLQFKIRDKIRFY